MIAQLVALNTLCVSLFGSVLNLLTIWMVQRHTQPEMRIYSRILLQTCITDLLAICSNALVQPVFFSDNGIGTVWSYGPVHFLPNPWQCLGFLVYVFMMRFSTSSISSLFIYRFLVVKRGVTMSLGRYACLLAAITLPLAILVGSSFISNCPTAANEHLENALMADILGLDNGTVERNVLSMRANPANGGSSFTASLALCLSVSTYLVVIFCGISIHVHIRRRYTGPTMAVKRQVDGQITVVLAVQAMLPMLSFLPQLVVNVLIRLRYSKGLLPMYVGVFNPAPWICVLNPLATLLCVRTYRATLYKLAYALGSCKLLRRMPTSLPNLSCQPKQKNTSSDEILAEDEESEGSETLL